MFKNRYLTFLALLTAGLVAGTADVSAQSEMDLLLFEKKAEGTQKANRGNPDAKTAAADIDISESLTDNLSKNNKKTGKAVPDNGRNTAGGIRDSGKGKSSDDGESESWLKSLISKGTSEIFKSPDEKAQAAEEKRIERVLLNRKSNAANFDISGLKLRMTPKEVEETMKQQGYKKILETLEVPNFIKWRSEELCRQHGVIGFERLNACATMVAKENGFQFVEHQVYNRYITKESIEVYFTSTFTDNLAHRIFYKSSVPFSDSKASKNVYLNNIKVFDFWRRIDLKYGKPDNTTEVKWGLGGKKPYLKAGTGKLELTDPLLKDLDTARMINEDTRFANTQYYTF